MFLIGIPVGSRGGSKHGDKSFDRTLSIGIIYLILSLMSCHGFLKNINSDVILKCFKRMLEYHLKNGLLFWNALIRIWKNFQMMQNKKLMQKKQIIHTT